MSVQNKNKVKLFVGHIEDICSKANATAKQNSQANKEIYQLRTSKILSWCFHYVCMSLFCVDLDDL